jgi:MFS family permease
LPACSGIIVSIVPSKHRAMASSISLVVFNLFGYFLSSVLSGYVMEIVQHLVPSCNEACALNIGFKLILLWSLWFLLFLTLGLKAAFAAVKSKYGGL